MSTKTPEAVAAELRKTADSIGASIVPEFLQKARVAIISDTRKNFQSASGPDGQPWPKLRFPRPSGGSKPLQSTGILRASLTTDQGPLNRIDYITANSLVIGTAIPYANIHQEGGTIVPKKAKALAIPLTKEAQRAGTPQRFPRKLFMMWRKGAKSGALAETVKSKGKRKTKSKTTVHYALVKSVTIPARPFLGFGTRLVKRLDEILARLIARAFDNKPNTEA